MESGGESRRSGGISSSNSSGTTGSSTSSSSNSSEASAVAEGEAEPSSEDEPVLRVEVPGCGKFGKIFITDLPGRRQFYAVCPWDVAHGKCRRSRTADKTSKKAQGRPLGYLAAWLMASGEYANNQAHGDFKPTHDERRVARATLAGQRHADTFFKFERSPRTSEDEEPEGCP